MKAKFKIVPTGWGIVYACTYATTVKGAVASARKRGWRDFHDRIDTRPVAANIYERTQDDRWELVAVVDAKCILAEDPVSRRSFKNADDTITRMRAIMADATTTMQQLNAISNKEYAKETSGK